MEEAVKSIFSKGIPFSDADFEWLLLCLFSLIEEVINFIDARSDWCIRTLNFIFWNNERAILSRDWVLRGSSDSPVSRDSWYQVLTGSYWHWSSGAATLHSETRLWIYYFSGRLLICSRSASTSKQEELVLGGKCVHWHISVGQRRICKVNQCLLFREQCSLSYSIGQWLCSDW